MINKESNKKNEKMIESGKRLKRCRKESGFSQADLAEILNCSNNHISMIERGERNLTYENAEFLSKKLNCSAEYLLCKSDFKNTEEELSYKKQFFDNMDNSLINFLQSIGCTVTFNTLSKCENLGVKGKFNRNCSYKDTKNPEYLDLINIKYDNEYYSMTVYDYTWMRDDIINYIEYRLDQVHEIQDRIVDREEVYSEDAVYKNIPKEEMSNLSKKYVIPFKKND